MSENLSLWVVGRPTAFPGLGELLASGAVVTGRFLRLADAVVAWSRQPPPVAALLDLALTDSQGFDSLTVLLEHAGGVPVVVVSDDPLVLKEAVSLGAEDAVPVADGPALLRAVRHAAHRARDRGTAVSPGLNHLGLSLDPLLVVDAEGRPLRINHRFTEMLGWTLDELVRSGVHELIDPLDRPAWTHALQEPIVPGDVRVLTHRFRHREGNRVWLEWHMTDDPGARHRVMAARDVTTSVREREVLRKRARQDPLTGLANRAALETYLTESETLDRELVVLFCDVDGFKWINDSHGHLVGDRVLRAIAGRLRGVVRSEADMVARFAGDEFVIAVPHDRGKGPETAARLVARARAAMGRPIRVGEHAIPARLSIGVATGAAGEVGAAALLHTADESLYAEKRPGRAVAEAAREREHQSG